MTVSPFYFRFYMCVQILITIERKIKIFIFWANGPIIRELGGGGVVGTRIGRALIVINNYILPQGIQKPESTEKNHVQ